ncbi:MAG: VOC family protein [Candidatus Thorarchaeota archaeon]
MNKTDTKFEKEPNINSSMKFSNSNDVALVLQDLSEGVAFFRDVLGLGVERLNEDTFKVATTGYNLYLTEGDSFSVLMEFLVSDIEEAKRTCLENGCTVHKWEKGDRWMRHPLGFMFNLDDRNPSQ